MRTVTTTLNKEQMAEYNRMEAEGYEDTAIWMRMEDMLMEERAEYDKLMDRYGDEVLAWASTFGIEHDGGEGV